MNISSCSPSDAPRECDGTSNDHTISKAFSNMYHNPSLPSSKFKENNQCQSPRPLSSLDRECLRVAQQLCSSNPPSQDHATRKYAEPSNKMEMPTCAIKLRTNGSYSIKGSASRSLTKQDQGNDQANYKFTSGNTKMVQFDSEKIAMSNCMPIAALKKGVSVSEENMLIKKKDSQAYLTTKEGSFCEKHEKCNFIFNDTRYTLKPIPPLPKRVRFDLSTTQFCNRKSNMNKNRLYKNMSNGVHIIPKTIKRHCMPIKRTLRRLDSKRDKQRIMSLVKKTFPELFQEGGK